MPAHRLSSRPSLGDPRTSTILSAILRTHVQPAACNAPQARATRATISRILAIVDKCRLQATDEEGLGSQKGKINAPRGLAAALCGILSTWRRGTAGDWHSQQVRHPLPEPTNDMYYVCGLVLSLHDYLHRPDGCSARMAECTEVTAGCQHVSA